MISPDCALGLKYQETYTRRRPSSTKNTTMIEIIVNYYAVVFLLPPPRTLLLEEKYLQFPGQWCLHKVCHDSKSQRDSKFTWRSKFTTRSISTRGGPLYTHRRQVPKRGRSKRRRTPKRAQTQMTGTSNKSSYRYRLEGIFSIFFGLLGPYPGRRFGYFLFFSAGGEGKGCPRRRGRGGRGLFFEIPGGGGSLWRVGGGGARGREGVCGGIVGGGGAKFFFSGPKFPPRYDFLKKNRVGHSRCEGVAERNRGNYRSGFLPLVAVAGEFFSKNEVRKLGIFQVASNVSFHYMASSKNHPNLAEIGVRKKSVSMRKLKLRELNAEDCVYHIALYAAIPKEKPFAQKKMAKAR